MYEINKAAVIGTGTMGLGIAGQLANAGNDHLTPHDFTTGTQIAMIVSGGDIDAGTKLSENDICALEREAFLTLARTAETRARIEHMLNTGSPLRN